MTNERLPGDMSFRLSPSYSTFSFNSNQHSDSILVIRDWTEALPFNVSLSSIPELIRVFTESSISVFVVFLYPSTICLIKSFIAPERKEILSLRAVSNPFFNAISEVNFTPSCCILMCEAISFIISKYSR